MNEHLEVKNELEALATLRSVVRAYGEIAALRMHKTRDFVLKNRSFLFYINSLFQEVLLAFRSQKTMKLSNERSGTKNGQITLLSHNGKTVRVFLSANTGLYGVVQKQTFMHFINQVEKSECEVTIIGKYGASLFIALKGESSPFTYFDFPDYGTNPKQLEVIIKHLVQYKEIDLYYPKFESVITQVPAELGVSSETFLTPADPHAKPRHNYIFEPKIEDILVFFETEIFASLFDQTMRESQLAKFASRIISMDQADANVRKRVREVKLQEQILAHRQLNRKQQGLLASVFLQRFTV